MFYYYYMYLNIGIIIYYSFFVKDNTIEYKNIMIFLRMYDDKNDIFLQYFLMIYRFEILL